MRQITWSGRFLDRRYLPRVTEKEWKATTEFVKSRLTDHVIESAVKRMPPEIYAKAAPEMLKKLKYRHDHLDEISMKYYKQINRVIDIFTSNQDDYVEVNRVSDKKNPGWRVQAGQKNRRCQKARIVYPDGG